MSFKNKIRDLIKIYEEDNSKGKLGEYAIGRLNGFKTALDIFEIEELNSGLIKKNKSCEFCDNGCEECFPKFPESNI